MKRVHKNALYYLVPFLMILFMFLVWRGLYMNHKVSSPIGQSIPTFNVPQLYHSEKRLTNHTLKGKVVLINFWASWCPPCLAEHDTLMQIQETGLPLYGINRGDTVNNAKKMLKKQGNPYTIAAMDESGVTGNLFEVSVLPQTFLVDASGKIRFRHQGMLDQHTWEHVLRPLVHKIENESSFNQ